MSTSPECTWRAQRCVIGGAVHPGVPEHDVGAVVEDASAVPQPPDRVEDDVVTVPDLKIRIGHTTES